MRDPYRCIYTSSYDRGLDVLLEIWPQVVKEVPKANLHIFYGWQLFDLAHKDNPASMMWKSKVVEGMEQESVTHHGRVSQPEIIEEIKKSGLWTYPTYFGEINCISAIKAQAHGAIPVVVNYAALKETVQYGVKVEGDIYDQETKDEYTKQLIAILKDHDRQKEIRPGMMKWAKEKYGWNKIAKNWSDLFKEENAKKES